jgi:hypothetical protein
MQRRARVVPLARTRLENLRLELRARPPANWPQHIGLAWQVLHDDLAVSEDDSRRLVIASVSVAFGCAQRVDQRSRAGAQARSITKLSKAFARLAKCSRRGSAKLRQDLDQAVFAVLCQTPVDLEVVEAIFDAAGTSFAKHPTEEPASTALATLESSEDDGVLRIGLKVDFESLPSASQLRMQTTLSDLVTSAAGDLTAERIFSTMVSVLDTEFMNADPEIACLITDYVGAVDDLWRAAGLHTGRGHDPANPEYRSPFHRFVELVLTAMIDPWSRRHDDDLDEHRRAVWQAHAMLEEEYKRAGAGLSRADREWLVSEYHIKRALARSAQKTVPETP